MNRIFPGRKRLRVVGLSSLLLLAAFARSAFAENPSRPATWAAAVEGTHVPNLYRVEPDLLRSAQPDPAGFKELTALGIKTVLDLRADHADAGEAGSAVLRFLHVPMRAWSVRDDQVVSALRILADRSNRPILIHCQKGADRTGMILALYRVVVQGWTKQDALREMNEGGYHHSALFRNLDRYVVNADVSALRRELAITLPIAPTVAAASAPAVLEPPALALPKALPLPSLISLDASAPGR